jgi:hypothetical protein
MTDVVERTMSDERRHGLDPVRSQLDATAERATAAVRRRSDVFWEEYAAHRDPVVLAAWFVPRCWREIDYVFMLGEVIRRYGLGFERKHVTALSRQLLDEAEHYERVGRIIERLGGSVPVQPPPSALRWSAFLWESLDRHRLGAIAAWNLSETAATGTLDGIVEAGRRFDLPELVRAYEQIIEDERFHVGLGRLLLDRYAESDADRAAVMDAYEGMAEIVVDSHTAIDLPL